MKTRGEAYEEKLTLIEGYTSEQRVVSQVKIHLHLLTVTPDFTRPIVYDACLDRLPWRGCHIPRSQ